MRRDENWARDWRSISRRQSVAGRGTQRTGDAGIEGARSGGGGEAIGAGMRSTPAAAARMSNLELLPGFGQGLS